MSVKDESIKNEFRFASSSIVAHVVRGVLVGIVVGCIVSSFRFLIEHMFHLVQGLYIAMPSQSFYLLIMVVGYGLIVRKCRCFIAISNNGPIEYWVV